MLRVFAALMLMTPYSQALASHSAVTRLQYARRTNKICLAQDSPSRAQKLVRQRLDPFANLDDMSMMQLKKYSYALQIEVRQLIKEEQAAQEFTKQIKSLLDEATEEVVTEDTLVDKTGLIAAMKVEGYVRYGLAYANGRTSWDKLRTKHPEFEGFTDAQLLAAFQASGKGISGTFGELF